MGQGVFITGTDTGVGKTVIAAGLAAYLKVQAIKVAVMKPVQTGGKKVNGKLESEDLNLLLRASAVKESQAMTNPYCLELPAAPSLAAEAAGIKLDPRRIIEAYHNLAARYRMVIVEGAGGLMVPLRAAYTFVDLIKQLKLPLVIVARASLGTINHTALTVNCAQGAGIMVAGIILNHTQAGKGDIVEKANPEIIQQLTGVPVWGVMPYSPSISVAQTRLGNVAALIKKHLNLTWLNQQLQ
jgi:dethiobiotin synthetase